jgi:thymidylate kinase
MEICITGGDGVGKSTLTKSVEARLTANGKTVYNCSIWDTLKAMIKYFKADIKGKDEVQEYLKSCSSTSRVFFLFHAMSYSLEEARKSDADIILIDSYWYKYAITESLMGTDINELKNIARIFPKLDKVFWLSLDPKIAFDRKKQVGLSKYEMGGKSGTEGEEFFKKILQKSQSLWKNLKEDNWIELDASQSVENLTDQLLNNI